MGDRGINADKFSSVLVGMKFGIRLIASLLMFVWFASTGWAAPQGIELTRDHNGVQLLALSANPAKTFDTKLVPAKIGLRNLARALERLSKKSSLSAKKLRLLKQSGRVVLVYLPDDLKNSTGGENVASFIPDFLREPDARGREKTFLVVVGRHGIKWPIDELAATLAHELVGHGVQHQRGRLTSVRPIDAECEAYLYEEIANQDLGLDKQTREMIAFRRSLEDRWCADFKAYLRAERPNVLPLWDTLNPDVPELLAAFEHYLQHAANAGVTAKAIDALKRQTRERRKLSLKDASPEELFNAAVKLRDGAIGIRPDATEAFRYFQRAAENGHPKSWVNVAYMYEKGVGVAKDVPEALNWYRKAAGLGNVLAQTQLGWLYTVGEGVPKDYAAAYNWLTKAARQNYAPAAYNLATLHRRGLGRERDDAAAAMLYRQAAEQGHTESQYRLGWYLFRGVGVYKDQREAALWVTKAAASGHAVSQNSLGWMYTKGAGVTKDLGIAAAWFRKSAEQGFAKAEARLGWLYLKGIATPKDTIEAYRWFARAASNEGAAEKVRMEARIQRDKIAATMSAADLAEATQR